MSTSGSIAVIGYALRLPGGVSNSQQMWSALREGQNLYKKFDRTWLPEFMNGMNVAQVGGYSTVGLLNDQEITDFDCELFNMAPREVKMLDPKQRLVLKTIWEAVENAGYNPKSLSGSETAVFIANGGNDFEQIVFNDYKQVNGYSGTGTTVSSICGRASFYFNLVGPSLTFNSRGDASLVALHSGIRSLTMHESNLSIVSGVRIILTPETTISSAKAGLLSASGNCRPFDEQADGTILAEACVTVLLKRTEDAIRDRDHIYAEVVFSELGFAPTNGKSSDIQSSREKLNYAMQKYGIRYENIQCIEAHGYGTKKGDEDEIQHLNKLCLAQMGDKPPVLGTVNAIFGNSITVTGLTSLLKIILCFQENVIFGPGKKVSNWTGTKAALLTSFGYGASYAHMLIKQSQATAQNQDVGTGLRILKISAKNQDSLELMNQKYADFLEKNEKVSLDDFCYTACVGRSDFLYRKVVVGDNIQSIIGGLRSGAPDNSRIFNSKISEVVKDGQVPNSVGDAASSYVRGIAFDWDQLPIWQSKNRIMLPTYEFKNQRFWIS